MTKTMTIEGITKKELQECIDHFEKMGKTYFWNTPSNAAGRRWEEKRNSQTWEYTIDGKKVVADVDVDCTCSNYITHRSVVVDGVSKKMMVPFLKKCIATL